MSGRYRRFGPWLLALGLIGIGAAISFEFFADHSVIRARSQVAEAAAEARRLETEREFATSTAERDSLERAVSGARQALETARDHEARSVERRAGLWDWNGASTMVLASSIILIASAIVVLRRTSIRGRGV